jgi:cysteine-S-conjugate beta-lyase
VSFDAVVERRGTGSFKWDLPPDGVLPFWVADMDFLSPPAVVRALQERAAHGVFGYTLVGQSLRDAIRDWLRARYGWRIDGEWLVWLPGVVPGLGLMCLAFAEPGEAVMTVTPAYPPFLEAPPARGRRVIAVPAIETLGGWRLPLEAMEAAVTPHTRVLLFCHPHNPLGRVWREDEVAAVVDLCRRHDLVLCSDEIHCDLILDPLTHVPAAIVEAGGTAAGAAAVSSTIVTFMSPSKTFNLAGLNFAFAVIPDAALRRRFVAAGRQLLPFPGCFAAVAAEAAYAEAADWLTGLLDYLRANRDTLERFVAAELPGVRMAHVEATYLAWLDVRALGIADPPQACRRAGIALSDGADFGTPGFLRLNFGCPRSLLEEGLRRLRTALRR